MKLFLSLLAVLLFASPASALSLRWNTVSTDASGAPLEPSLLPTGYKVYQCNTPSTGCDKSSATVVITVPALNPQPQQMTFVIDGRPSPASYFVTVENIVSESAESNTVKVTPAGKTAVDLVK